MPNSSVPYLPEIRQQAIDLVRGGRNAEDLFREFQPSARSIHNRVREAEGDADRRSDTAAGAHRAEKPPS